MLCLVKEFLKEQKMEDLCFAVIPKSVQEMEKLNSISLEIQPLLNEFKEIVVDDLSTCLLPLSSVSHHIDLMLGSSSPNKASHRMTPAENEEVNKQVQKLLDRGLIRVFVLYQRH